MKEYTIEELIETLKLQANYLSSYEDSKLNKAFDTAIKALEKQIPTKPNGEEFINGYWCSRCGDSKTVRTHYCSNCGQKLKWV